MPGSTNDLLLSMGGGIAIVYWVLGGRFINAANCCLATPSSRPNACTSRRMPSISRW
ncbi:hypothetical protein D3C71_1321110 [compost metagenome]